MPYFHRAAAMDAITNRNETTMVARNRSRSKPRRVRNVEYVAPKRPDPVPFTWNRHATMRKRARMMTRTFRIVPWLICFSLGSYGFGSFWRRSFNRSWTTLGLARPLLAFITWPTRNLTAVSLPPR